MSSRHNRIGRALLLAALLVSSATLSMLPGVSALSFSPSSGGPGTLTSTTFLSAPPSGAKGPDDITLLSTEGVDGGKPVIYTAFQNGIGADGTPGTLGPQSTIAGYDQSTGTLVLTIKVTGKVDGLTADPDLGALIATDNEDSNSAFNLVYPETSTVVTYAYSPNPAVGGNGGTDSAAVIHGKIYVSHSNPNDLTQATDYRVTLDKSTHTAKLTPVFFDNSMATDVVSGKMVQLALTDPDTNFLMPEQSARFAGALATISQADGQIVFASHLSHNPKLKVLSVTDNKAGNVPPIDGFAVATSDHGTLYVVDNGAGKILALDTSGWKAGTVFVGEPSDNANPLVGTLNLSTGAITPLGNHFTSPKGLLFVPAHEQDDNHGNISA